MSWREPACGTKMRDGSDEGEIGSVSASVPLMELMTSMAGDAQSHKMNTSHCLAVRMIVPSSHGMGARMHVARCVRGGGDLGLSGIVRLDPVGLGLEGAGKWVSRHAGGPGAPRLQRTQNHPQ